MGKIPTFDGLDPAIVNFGTDKVEIWRGERTYGSLLYAKFHISRCNASLKPIFGLRVNEISAWLTCGLSGH